MKKTAEFAKRQGRKAPKSVLQHYCISSLRLSRCKHSDYIYIEALGIVLLITLLTLVYQLEKAARVNVASVVKTE